MPLRAVVVLDWKLTLTRERLPFSIRQARKNIGEVAREAPGLRQSEIAGNEEHHYNNTNDVKNIVHVSFSFLSSDRIYC
jgi:hypothetical protein